MRTFVRFGVPALTLVAALMAARTWSRRPVAPAPATQTVSDDRDTVERDLLRGEVRRLGLEVATLHAQQRAADAGVSGTPREEAPPRPSPERELAWLAARARFLDDALAQQSRDERWATSLETKARALYGTPKDGISLVNVACRSTACRMEFSYTDEEARKTHLHGIGAQLPELPRVSYAYPGEPESHTRAVLFLAVQEHPLPTYDYQTFVASMDDSNVVGRSSSRSALGAP